MKCLWCTGSLPFPGNDLNFGRVNNHLGQMLCRRVHVPFLMHVPCHPCAHVTKPLTAPGRENFCALLGIPLRTGATSPSHPGGCRSALGGAYLPLQVPCQNDIISGTMLDPSLPTTPVAPPGEISPDEISPVASEIRPGEISPVRFSGSSDEICPSDFSTSGHPVKPDRPFLIRIDPLLLAEIDAERPKCPTENGKPGPRTRVMRALMREALDARANRVAPPAPKPVDMGVYIDGVRVGEFAGAGPVGPK